MRRTGIVVASAFTAAALAVPLANARSVKPDVRMAPIAISVHGRHVNAVRRGERFDVVLRFDVLGAPARRGMRVRAYARFAHRNYGLFIIGRVHRVSSGQWRWVLPVQMPRNFPRGRYAGFVILRLYERTPKRAAAAVRLPTILVR